MSAVVSFYEARARLRGTAMPPLAIVARADLRVGDVVFDRKLNCRAWVSAVFPGPLGRTGFCYIRARGAQFMRRADEVERGEPDARPCDSEPA
jgi:hypothetical protein